MRYLHAICKTSLVPSLIPRLAPREPGNEATLYLVGQIEVKQLYIRTQSLQYTQSYVALIYGKVVEKKEPGTHFLRTLSSPRISEKFP